MSALLYQAFIYLAAAVIAVPIAKRLGLGSVLGYLIAGIVIGPVIGLVGTETQALQHYAEFGVVMMLFIVGLELEPRALWEMRRKLLGLGGLQVTITVVAITGIAVFLGQPWRVALAIGLVFSLSSTAIVLQTLKEKGWMKTEGGKSSFSVLLFQDIAVIPMLALIPLLAMPEWLDATTPVLEPASGHGSGAQDVPDSHHGSSMSLIDGKPAWLVTLITLGAIAAVIIGGHFLNRTVFRFIAAARLREIFTAAALLLVVGIALLMSMVGLSPALGTFLAGVVLANSEYRHELESDIEPFKGLLLGLFFITVGAGINFGVLFDHLTVILGLTLGLILLKATVLWTIAHTTKTVGPDKWLFTLGLAQAGEFGFVLLSFTAQHHVIPQTLSQTLLMVVALSMLLTPVLFIIYEKLIEPRLLASINREADEIDEKGAVLIAGVGRFGGLINRILLSCDIKPVVLDTNEELLEMARTFGFKAYYGDATRPDLLHAAGLEDAKILVVTIDNPQRSIELVRHARAVNPDIHIVARALHRHHVYELYQAGANDIIRDYFDSAVRAGRSVLEATGIHPFEAEQLVTEFTKIDQMRLRELADLWKPDVPILKNTAYIERAKQLIAEADKLITQHEHTLIRRTDSSWQPPREDDQFKPEK